MSDKDRSIAHDGGRGGGGEGSGGSDDDDGEGPEEKCKGFEKKGKKVFFFRLRKSKKLRHHKGKQKGICVSSVCRGRMVGSGGWCCLCFKQPRTLDSSGESPTSDPNSSEFTFDMLMALIEKNDFYSKECNPHLAADC